MAKERERTGILHCRMRPDELAMIDHLVEALETDDRTTLIRRLVKQAYNKDLRRKEKESKP